MRSSRRLLLLAAFVATADVAHAHAHAADGSAPSAELVGGVPEDGFPAVGYMAIELPTGWVLPFCGATLIRADVAVTAAHCVVGAAERGATRIAFGAGAAGSSPLHLVERTVIHPDYDQLANLGNGNDLALMLLASPVTAVAPARIGDPQIGCDYRSVGYGRVLSGPPELPDGYTGERKSAAVCIDSAGIGGGGEQDPGILRITVEDGSLCYGDSGGAVMSDDETTLIGVHSYILDGTCPLGGSAGVVNVGVHLRWIEHEVGHPPTLRVIAPVAGLPLEPGFTIAAEARDDLRLNRVELWLNRELLARSADAIVTAAAPADLEPGEHVIELVAYDADETRVSTLLEVHVSEPPMPPPDAGAPDASAPDAGAPDAAAPGTPAPDADPPGSPAGDRAGSGGCATSRGDGAAIPLVLALALALRRRARRVVSALAVVALAAACGEVVAFDDAGVPPTPDTPDAAATPPDAPAPPAIVRVLERGAPASGVDVLFHDADGALIARVVTDGDGEAPRPADAASATIVGVPTEPRDLATIDLAGVGAVVEVGARAPRDLSPGPALDLAIATPAGVTSVRASAPCAGTTAVPADGEVAITLRPPVACVPPDATYPAILQSDDAAALYAIITVPSGGGAIDVPVTAWRPLVTIDHALVNVPADVGRVELLRRGLVGDVAISGRSRTAQGAGPHELAIPFPHVADGEVLLVIEARPNIREAVVRRPAGDAAPLDLGALLLPAPARPTLDHAAGTVSWTSSEPIVADLVEIVVEYARGELGEISGHWRFYAPSTRTTWRLPALPEDLADLAPLPTDDYENATDVLDSADHDYADLVEHLIDLGRVRDGLDASVVRLSAGV